MGGQGSGLRFFKAWSEESGACHGRRFCLGQ
jgi:hypothetical protein